MSIGNKVSVVIVNYNSSENCRILIKSLTKINEIIGEVIVIDNCSRKLDRLLVKKVKGIKLIVNKKNLGFSKAVNQGITHSKFSYILLLNPDCKILDKSPIKTFHKIRKNKCIGIIGGKIINSETGATQLSATSKPSFQTGLFEFTNLKKIFPNNKFSSEFWIEKNYKILKPKKVFSLCGAYTFLKRKKWLTFNEKYFLYLEDLDLGNIIEKNNLEAWFDPESTVSHIGGKSNNSEYRIILRQWYASRKIYFKDNLPNIQGDLLYIIFSIEELLLKIFHFFTHTSNE